MGERAERIALWLIGAAALAALVLGWRAFWFLADDAYIAFRYADNALSGHGYVWSPAPYRPVEGYTSFLWVALLARVWRLFGVEPPDAANRISLLFSALTLLVGAAMVLRMGLREPLRRVRAALLALVLAGTVANPTFLAWTSSGMETALFNFLVTLWIACALYLPAGTPRRLAGMSAAAALAALTRPEGLLAAAATLLLAFGALLSRSRAPAESASAGAGGHARGSSPPAGDGLQPLAAAAALAPLLLVPAHLIWRRVTYGLWLPNTYYAKTMPGRIWPESGLRYAASFVIEQSLWIWLGLAAAVLALGIARVGAPAVLHRLSAARLSALLAPSVHAGAAAARQAPFWRDPPVGLLLLLGALVSLRLWIAGAPAPAVMILSVLLWTAAGFGLLGLHPAPLAVGAVLAVHLCFYTLVTGGDHFEFRVLSHLILLAFVSALWLLDRLGAGGKTALATMAAFVALSLPIPWTHWLSARDIRTREATHFLKVSVADAAIRADVPLPRPLMGWLRLHDRLQFWLIDHMVCMRHREHAEFHRHLLATLVSRSRGLAMSAERNHVTFGASVGVLGWVLPKVHVLDTGGLNDYVVARNVPRPGEKRLMAHERAPFDGYLECFDPDVEFDRGSLVVRARERPLTSDRIRDCEERFGRIADAAWARAR